MSERGAEPFKIHLSVNVHTVSVKLPGGCDSAEAVKVQLESLLLSNKYSVTDLSGAGGEAYQPIAEALQLDFHQLSVSK